MSSRGTTLRPLKEEDIDQLLSWFKAPHVVPWWCAEAETPSCSLRDRYLEKLQPQSINRVYIIQLDQKPVGMIESYRLQDFPRREKIFAIDNALALDFLIGAEEHLGRGAATHAIKIMSKTAFTIYKEIECIVAMPQKENTAACRALEKAGFSLVRQENLDLKKLDQEQLHSNHALNLGLSSIYRRQR